MKISIDIPIRLANPLIDYGELILGTGTMKETCEAIIKNTLNTYIDKVCEYGSMAEENEKE